jgi:hypothetical protein
MELPPSRVAALVASALGGDELDLAVRDLARERLEGLLLTTVRAALGSDAVERVELSLADGAVSLASSPTLTAAEAAGLRERLDRVLLARLAATVGAARIDVRNGVRAGPRAGAVALAAAVHPTPEAPARWEDVVSALAAVVASQQRRIDALAARLGEPGADADAVDLLARVAAMLEGRARR